MAVNGKKYQVCKAGLMHIFQVKSTRLRNIQKKMENGDMLPKDMRGLHDNRPHRISEEVKALIRQHIQRFRTYESHYERKEGDPLRKYLAPDLSIGKMYDLFIEYVRETDQSECENWIYTHIFKTEFDLKFGNPKLDSCDTCDKFCAKLKSCEDEETMLLLKDEQALHQDIGTINSNYCYVLDVMVDFVLGKISYDSYKADCTQAKIDPAFVVLTVDLEQDFFSPELTNKSWDPQQQGRFGNYVSMDGNKWEKRVK